MPYLLDLADACRKSGLRVVEVTGWQVRGHGAMGALKAIMPHWTATPGTVRPAESYPSLGIVRDGRQGLPGPLSALGFGRDATVYVIAAGMSYHAGSGYHKLIGANGNLNALGIECESAGEWTDAQLDGYPLLCGTLARHYGLGYDRIIPHHEWTTRKIDIKTWPGGMTAFRASAAIPPEEDELDMDRKTFEQWTHNGFLQALRNPEVRSEIATIAWRETTVHRGGKQVSALQELADAKTKATEAAATGDTVDYGRLADALISRGFAVAPPSIDYAALAAAVNDDAARRMAS